MIISMLDFIAYISCSEDLVIPNISDAFLIKIMSFGDAGAEVSRVITIQSFNRFTISKNGNNAQF